MLLKKWKWLASQASRSLIATRLEHSAAYPRYQSLTALDDDSLIHFRENYFHPERPAVLPRGHFRQTLPAYERWFRHASPSFSSSSSDLHVEYLREHAAEALVPLELTRLPAQTTHNNNDAPTFARFHAPLNLFLDWIQLGEVESPTRLYLAQCQFLDIPQVLRDDLPTPSLVSEAGRGDVYDANVWIGLPPTYTPLHRDPNPNLFVQLAGQKVVRLLPPDDGLALFASVRRSLGRSSDWEAAVFRGDEMMQGDEMVLLDHAVWKEDTAATAKESYEAHLGPGDGLFIPKGWWHSIKGIGNGVTASVSWLFPSAICSLPCVHEYLLILIIGQLVV